MRDAEVDLEVDRSEGLLERSAALDSLTAERAAVETEGGRVVFIAGEAGIGKTTFLRAFRARHETGSRFFWGACDPLFTPRPLGPFADIAEPAGGEFQALVEEGAKPYEVANALLRELARRPTVLVLEDLHWADEASLDVLRIVTSRISDVPALLLATYRDDELRADHPLRGVLGELVRGRSVRRMSLDLFSPAAVARLAEPHAVDARELYEATGGNPFFVTEVLAGGKEEIPETVRDAVLARVSRLPTPARSLLDAAAISSQPTELWLLEVLAPGEIDALDACLASGVLNADAEAVAFRHELARLAIEEAIPTRRRAKLHREALEALSERDTSDLARLAHHADAARDEDAVRRYAPAAAERAAALGAHREAAAQYERALRYADELPPESRAELLDRAAEECRLVGRATDAIELRRRAARIHSETGDRIGEGDSLRALVWPSWLIGRTAEAEAAGREAIAVLEAAGGGIELARAYAAMALLGATGGDRRETYAWGRRAIELAERLGETQPIAEALVHMGAVELEHDETRGREMLTQGLELSREHGHPAEAAAAFVYLARGAGRQWRFDEAERWIETAIEHCNRYDLEGSSPYLFMTRAECELERGEWSRAEDSVALVLRAGGIGPATVGALAVLGRLRARRGAGSQWDPLDRALELVAGSGQLPRLGPIAVARAEAAWIEGRNDAALAETDRVWELALERGSPWTIGELALWRRAAGSDETPAVTLAEPYASTVAGDWREACRLWSELGCRNHWALAAAEGDEDHRKQALESLHALGAHGTAKAVTRRMRETGARNVPRGPRPQTSRNPAQLTARELEVLGLLAEGLRNAEIAERLVVSVRTVDHHVSAILRKLDVGSRAQAAAAAAELGLTRPT